MTKILTATTDFILQAVMVLKNGGLVGMPTETVYGLAGNALDGRAVARIYEAKGRPSFNPLIAHFHNKSQAMEYAEFSDDAHALADAFWPGPLTFVLPLKNNSSISSLATAGLETLAVRVPDHPAALNLIKACDFPLVAPSANKSGTLSPTTPAHVAENLDGEVDLILAAGACRIGLESTIIDLSTDKPIILRPGAITAEDIETVINQKIKFYNGNDADPLRPQSPGLLLKHYAPQTPLRLNAIDLEAGEALLAFGSNRFMGVRGGGAAKDLPEAMHRNLSLEGDLHEAAANLFAMLKELDRVKASRIAVMNIPQIGLGIAINDRLKRAAFGA